MADKVLRVSGPVALAVALVALVVVVLVGSVPEEEPVARSYACAVYTEQGCAKFVVASGGEIEVQSGGTVDVQRGATVGLAGGTVNGNQTITGSLVVSGTSDLVGAISSSTGAVTVTDGVNITGAVDCQDTFNADGAVTLNGSVDMDGNVSSGTGAITMTDDVVVTGTLTLEDVAFSGPLRFGTATSVVSGTTIAHGLGTTPTAVILTVESAGGFTTTFPYVRTTDATSITVAIADGVSIGTVHWLAGR